MTRAHAVARRSSSVAAAHSAAYMWHGNLWNHAALSTRKDQNLDKAHVRDLEARMVTLAREAKRAELDNGNVLQVPTLSEVGAADAEEIEARTVDGGEGFVVRAGSKAGWGAGPRLVLRDAGLGVALARNPPLCATHRIE